MTTKETTTSETETSGNGDRSETDAGAGEQETPDESETDEDGGEGSSTKTPREKFLRGKLRDTEKELDTLRREKAERERAEMSEADQLKADVEERDQRIADLLKSNIVTKFDLPEEFADRLRGVTEAELTEDAERLSELLGGRKTGDESTPKNPPAGSVGVGVGGSGESTESSDPVELSRQWLGRSF